MVQAVAECLHGFLGGALVREVRNLVETDEVNPAFQAPEQADEGVGVAFVVIPAGKHGVFEAHPALAGEVVAADEAHDVFFVPGLLNRHERCSFFGERIVQAHRQMAALPVEILLERGKQAYRAHRDALGTPAEAPGGGEDLQHFGYGGIVVQRLPHSHEYGVCEKLRRVDGDELVQDVVGGEVAVPALTAGHAEAATHLAAGLAAYAQGAAVVFRNHHRLDEGLFGFAGSGGAFYREQVFHGAVGGLRPACRGRRAEGKFFAESCLCSLGNIAHRIPGTDLFYVQPAGQLVAHERLETALLRSLPKFLKIFSEQVLHSDANLIIFDYICLPGDGLRGNI